MIYRHLVKKLILAVNHYRTLAAEYTQKTVDVLRSLSEDDLNKTIDATAAFGRKLPGSQLLQMAIDHEIHHKGNLYVYRT